MPAKRPFGLDSGTKLLPSRLQTAPASNPRKRETRAEKIVRAAHLTRLLTQAYPEIQVPLAHRNTFELLIAVILSAQCTDDAVNKVTPELFYRYPDPEKLARAARSDIEEIIRPLGLFRAKAKSLQRCAQQLVEDFSGQVPSTMEQLTRLTGVGRKTANVILGHAFGIPGIIVDTHCKRVSRRLGLTREKDPVNIERDLNRLLPAAEWTGFSHRLVIHGRKVCYARKPACVRCVLNQLCPSAELQKDMP